MVLYRVYLTASVTAVIAVLRRVTFSWHRSGALERVNLVLAVVVSTVLIALFAWHLRQELLREDEADNGGR